MIETTLELYKMIKISMQSYQFVKIKELLKKKHDPLQLVHYEHHYTCNTIEVFAILQIVGCFEDFES